MLRHLVALILAFVPIVPGAGAQALPSASPESVGLSSERLRRLSTAMQQAVDHGRAAGIVTLVARQGRIAHFAAFGRQDREAGVPMARDTIFRIASQSKAVTSVAVLMLMEEGKLLLSDPVSRFIPAFKKTRVLVPSPQGSPALPSIVPAIREITVHDLLTHTSGISYGWGTAQEQYAAAGVLGWYFADKDEPMGALIDRLAGLPFDAQPGERWVYGFSTDVLGVVVERASGQSLDEFFRTRIFGPLRMSDSHFFLPMEKRSRLSAVYTPKEGGLERAAEPRTGQGEYVNGPRRCLSGGAGLLSTAGDYARFLQMLANGGQLENVRLLSPKTVELMTSNHVGALHESGRFGFGLGFRITEHVGRSGRSGSVGEFGWGGAYLTEYWVDPRESLVAVFMTQLYPHEGSDLHERFRAMVYQSIVEPVGRTQDPSWR